MSECRLWWRSGEVQWCDMMSKSCRCGGWDESCDMKLARQRQAAKATQHMHMTLKQAAAKAEGKRLRRAA